MTWFTAAVKGYTLHPVKILPPWAAHTHIHTLPMLKQNLRGPSPDRPPPEESVDLAKSALMDDWTEQTSVFRRSELCAA